MTVALGRRWWLAAVVVLAPAVASSSHADPRTVHVALRETPVGKLFSLTASTDGLRLGATVDEMERAILALDHTANIRKTLHTATLNVDGVTVVAAPYVSRMEAMSRPLDREHGAVEVVVNFSPPTAGTRAVGVFLNRDKRAGPQPRADFVASLLARFGPPSDDSSAPVEGGDADRRGNVDMVWRFDGARLVPCPVEPAGCGADQAAVDAGRLDTYERRLQAGETLIITARGFAQRPNPSTPQADPTVLPHTSINMESVELEALSMHEAVKQMQAAAHAPQR